MSEWRDRGYVLDSDEEEIALFDETRSNDTLPRTTITPIPRRGSVELVSDAGARDDVDENLGVSRDDPDRLEASSSFATSEAGKDGDEQHDNLFANTHDASSPKTDRISEETHQQDKSFTVRPDDHEPQRYSQKQPSVGQPIVLITQSRSAQSPPESSNKNVKTYSRKPKPGALKRIKSAANVAANIEQDQEKDDDFMDIDALVGDEDVEMEQAQPLTTPLVVPPQIERRLSVSSSDLSDVDMQVLSSSQPFFAQPSATAGTHDLTPRLASQSAETCLESAVNLLSDQDLAALGAHQPRRNLRTRKAIQLHPYLIEIEQYRRSLKARGLRPIQVATSSQRPGNQDDSQDAEFQQEESQPPGRHASHTQDSTLPGSSSASEQEQRLRLNLRQLIADDDDEFPDIDTAIRRHIISGTQIGNKRRKTHQVPQTGRGTLPTSRGSETLNLARTHSGTAGAVNQDLLPPSPPRTSSPFNVEVTPAAPRGFRLPNGMAPLVAPTPFPSSPERPTSTSVRRRQVVVSSDDEAASQNKSASDANSSAESDVDERQLMRMRRKIRGVLPASYLKLDRQTRQPNPSSRPAESETPMPIAPVRGIAQRRVTSNSTIPARQSSYVVFSDNESDSSLEELPASRLLRTRLPSSLAVRPLDSRLDTAEIDEHDEIDDMFPNAERPHFRLPGNHKRQSRLTDGFTTGSPRYKESRPGQKRKVTDTSRIRNSTSTPKPGTKVKKRSTAKKPPHLSILDATNTAQSKSPRAPLRPQFVRLAARQARNRPDHGRHSPTHKDIRLATREDTQEALEPLLSWRAGNISRAYNPPPQRTISSTNSVDDHRSPYKSKSMDLEDGLSTNHARNRRPGPPRPLLSDRSAVTREPRAKENERKRDARSVLLSNQRRMLERQHRMRPAQLETSAQITHRDLDLLTHAAPPSRLMEIFARDRGQQSASRFRLERFLQDKNDLTTMINSDQPKGQDVLMTGTDETVAPQRRTRKRATHRFDIETARFRQSGEPLPVEAPAVLVVHGDAASPVDPTAPMTLQGLGSFGTRYPTDFDVRPLEIGTYFATSTFVGSGDFSDCLTLRNRDLDVPAGRITVEVAGRSLHWSAWNEDVSAGLGTILSACTEDLHAVSEFEESEMRRTAIEDTAARFNYFLRSIVRYISGCLSFIDPIDRNSSLTRISRFTDEFLEAIEAEMLVLGLHQDTRAQTDGILVDSLLYLLCITTQCVRISQHPAADARTQSALTEKCIHLSKKVMAVALPLRFTAVRDFLETHRQHAQRESGIHEKDVAVKSVVVINHVLNSINSPLKLPDLLSAHLGHAVSRISNLHSLDHIWYDAFSIQPLLEVDAKGIFEPRSRFQASNDSWGLIKSLLQRTFELYPTTSKTRNPTLNDYVRACLTRVYHLITRWSWKRCEAALSTVYDFFARNNLSQLYREEGKGSPRFLEDLDNDPKIELDARDCAFHIFLKLLVVGLRGLQEILPKNKVRGFAWRFIPNHGRTYRKDQEVTHVALDALRNHHDLLCSLYWVLPPGCGPRLQMIKDLVDHDSSHREACRLSVHAWGILARYQLSQTEPFHDADVLASWFKDMIATTVSQYRLARSEAEAQYAVERSRGSFDISPEMLEATITTNQRSIFAILQDLLLAMRNAIKISKSWYTVRNVVEQSSVIEVLRMFDIDQPRLSVAITQTLDIVSELFDARSRLCKQAQQESQPGSDDSQDYGDWTFMEQVDGPEPENRQQNMSGVAFLQEPLAELLSTCFGSEKSPDDDLLKKVVHVWTTFAQNCVNDHTHDWSSFLDTYSTSSWFQLRDTEQKHKYTCYFLASVIKSDKSSLMNHRNLFMKAWFVSLLERESMLKFQHRLTASLLEKANSELLLHNLPFAVNHETGEYHVTLSELRERRLSLVSSILSNMYTSLNTINSSAVAERRREYIDMLKTAMQQMRRVYEQLQDMSSRLGGSSYAEVQGAYVTFVQQIISLMQQYTSEICPIDAFFVDSTAFPLPSKDPTYVVGRLKSYVPKLNDNRVRKQLAVFLQTVSERAASDDQQSYLIEQMQLSLTGNSSRDLRKVMFMALLPAYISCSTQTSLGWFLSTPLLEASGAVIGNMIYDLDTRDKEATEADVSAITYLLVSAHHWASKTCSSPSEDAGSLRMAGTIFGLVEQSLTFIDYVHRLTGKAGVAMKLLHDFVALGYNISEQSGIPLPESVDADVLTPESNPNDKSMQSPWQDTFDFATRNLSETLSRRNTNRNWTMNLASTEVESMRVMAAVEMLKRSAETILGIREPRYVRPIEEDGQTNDTEVEEEQELQRYRLDGIMRGMQGLGWRNLM